MATPTRFPRAWSRSRLPIAEFRKGNSCKIPISTNENGYVFATETGTPIDPANLRRSFRSLIKAAGIPAKQPTEDCPKPGQWHPHEMRHSAGSYMDHTGVPHEQIAEILGHAGPAPPRRSNQEIIY